MSSLRIPVGFLRQPRWVAQSELRNAEWVSFDVFDTLVKRDVRSHNDLLRMAASEIGVEVEAFVQSRVRADVEAQAVDPDYTIDAIYEHLQGYDAQTTEALKHAEMQLEVTLATASLPGRDLYEKTLATGRPVVLISDMYLSSETITQILERASITGYDALYVSNEHGASKRDGSLFRFVADRQAKPLRSLVHVGDSPRRDFLMPRRVGAKSILVRRDLPAVVAAEASKPRGLAPLVEVPSGTPRSDQASRTLAAFLNNRMQGVEDQFERFGYTALGPLLLGFGQYLHDEIAAGKYTNVVFAARDGHILRQAFELVAPDINTTYAYISRKSLRAGLLAGEVSFADLAREVFFAHPSISVGKLLGEIGLPNETVAALLREANVDPEEVLKRESYQRQASFETLIRIAPNYVADARVSVGAAVAAYLRTLDLGDRVALVDSGWSGTVQAYLERALEGAGIGANVTGFYLGLARAGRARLAAQALDMRGYLADFITDDRPGETLDVLLGFLEAWLYAPHGTTVGYSLEGEAILAPSDAEGGSLTDGVLRAQRAALRFVAEWSTEMAPRIEMPPQLAFSEFERYALSPSTREVDAFGDVTNNGQRLAPHSGLAAYLRAPQTLMRDFGESRWKSGFMRRLLRVNAPYAAVYARLLRGGYGAAANRQL